MSWRLQNAKDGCEERGGRVFLKHREGERDYVCSCVHVCMCVRKRERERERVNEKKIKKGCICMCGKLVCVCTGTEMDHQRLYLLRGHA